MTNQMTQVTNASMTLEEIARARAAELVGSRVATHAQAALAAIEARGFPTVREEQWRYFGTASLLRQEWTLRQDDVPPVNVTLPAFDAIRIDVVNGTARGVEGTLPDGLSIRPVAIAELEDERFGSSFDPAVHRFAALNSLAATEVLLIHVRRGFTVTRPLHVAFKASSSTGGLLVAPRVLVIAEPESQATIVETWDSEGSLLSIPVVEMFVDQNARLDHIRFVTESLGTVEIANHRAMLARDAVFRSFLFTLGSGLVRNEIAVGMNGEGADATLDAVWMLGGAQKADHHTTVDHVRPHTTSRQLYKGILSGRANGIFEGLVIVRPDAQKISSAQSNNNLLLSDTAVADSKPQLEIHADDVKCSHGSTIGQLEESTLFYLQSRGIGLDEARRMLTLAFAGEMIDRLPIEALREPLRDAVAERVPSAEVSR